MRRWSEDGQERWIKDEKDPMRSDLFLCTGSLPKAGEGERSADGFAVRFFTFHVFQQFFKVDDEQRQRRQDGDRICDRFREEDGEHLIAEEMIFRKTARKALILELPKAMKVCWQETCSPISRTPAM